MPSAERANSQSSIRTRRRQRRHADPGFAAYLRVDPVIVADTDGSGFIPADAALQVNEAGVGVPSMTLPPIPGGVVFHAAIRTTTNNTNHTNKGQHADVAADGLYDLLAWQMLTPPSRRLLRR